MEPWGDERAHRLELLVGDLLRRALDADPDSLYRAPAEGEWTAMQTLAHVAEVLRFWAGQAHAVATYPANRPRFGRATIDFERDPDRLAAIEQHGFDSVESMAGAIHTSLSDAVRIVRSIPAAAWDRVGIHPEHGDETVRHIVDEYLLHHVERHLRQLDEALS